MNNLTTTGKHRKLELDKKLKQIENDELRLKHLEQELITLQARVAEEAAPLVKEFCDLRNESLSRLKHHLTDSFFKKKEKRQIVHLLTELALGLQSMGDLRAESFLDELISKESDEDKTEAKEKNNKFSSYEFKPFQPTDNQVEENFEIKSLFRQLAKVFHPDKEPLEHLKEEKTSLMKKITAAYENQDLYGLLKLEKEHLGHREFSEEKVDLYIKHINDRLKGLKSIEATLKKHGPLSAIYKMIYSRKVTTQEYNIKNELSKIENKIQKEKQFQQVLWDSTTLRNFFKT